MNKFLNSFVFPMMIFFAVIFTAYTAVMYSLKHIKSDPINQKYATLKEMEQSLDCLTENIYFEAAGSNVESKISVGQITLNRLSSGKYGNTVCKVVHSPSQFSWTISKPRALRVRDKVAYNESREVAKKVLLEGFRLPSITKATYYHTDYIPQPYWARNMRKVAKIGSHIFYEG